MAKTFKNKYGKWTSHAKGAKLISGTTGKWRVKGLDEHFATFHRAKHAANKIAYK